MIAIVASVIKRSTRTRPEPGGISPSFRKAHFADHTPLKFSSTLCNPHRHWNIEVIR